MNDTTKKGLSENAKRLESMIFASFHKGIPNEVEIETTAVLLRALPFCAVSDDEFSQIIRRLHEALCIGMDVGSCVAVEHEPWLNARKSSIDPYYWTRYEADLSKKGWAPAVLRVLDKVTDEILDRLGDPKSDLHWDRRGLVIGDVQSGKTSNYTGLICKAADAGYRLIILLTGTLESLRRQTQERLDEGFVGLDSSALLNRGRKQREIGVGLINRTRAAGVLTSSKSDFRANTVNSLGFNVRDYKEPMLLVLKKNKSVIENLTNWLINVNANNSQEIELPMLIIDDEADNASINTKVDSITAINAGIRKLLKIFPRSSYVGFTATPFANVFIDPDTDDAMIKDDLFPRDFIYALDAPTNYIGARTIFCGEQRHPSIKIIDDAAKIFPQGQKSDNKITGLPESLFESIRSYLIVNAILDLRGTGPLHRSMLINVSHFTQIQDQVREMVEDFLRDIKRVIQNYSMLDPIEALRSHPELAALKCTFDSIYFSAEFDWHQIQYALKDAIMPMEVRSVNQKSGAASLDYKPYKQSGLRLIAVGGNSLARGLTLEGLVTSYFYRHTQMYDALLQMGRWFGYRQGYEDLFRIWISIEAHGWYAHISEAADELRGDVKYMQKTGQIPKDFGLRVRSHPDSLLITARNKMRTATDFVHTVAVSAESIETPRLKLNSNDIINNYRAAQYFVADIIRDGFVFEKDSEFQQSSPFWSGIPKKYILNFLESFVGHPLHPQSDPRALANFIRDKYEGDKLELWDVAIPGGRCDPLPIFPNLQDIKPRSRPIKIDKGGKDSILINADKMRVGAPEDDEIGLSKLTIREVEKRFFGENPQKKTVPSKTYCAVRDRPLLLLHLIQPVIAEQDFPWELPGDCQALVAMGIKFPTLDPAHKAITYRISIVELRNLLAAAEERGNDDLEDDDDDGNKP